MEEDLAARKLVQRAEGLLIARRSLTAASAKRWISETSRKTGLLNSEVAYRIIAYYQELMEQRIA
jgi:AmiR/NasT family two-component response regulator